MGNMFLTPSRPFYQSVSMMHLESIPLAKYTAFAQLHFAQAGKSITDETVETIYRRFDGITWYMQKVLHTLYDMTPAQGTCEVKMVEEAIRQIIDSFKFTYSEILFRIPEKQKELLIAITKEGKAKAITSAAFIKKYKLSSSSSVQSALKGLLEKDFITQELGIYQIYDQFFRYLAKRELLSPSKAKHSKKEFPIDFFQKDSKTPYLPTASIYKKRQIERWSNR